MHLQKYLKSLQMFVMQCLEYMDFWNIRKAKFSSQFKTCLYNSNEKKDPTLVKT